MAPRGPIAAFLLAAAVAGQDPLPDRTTDELVAALIADDGAVAAQLALLRRGAAAAPALGEAVAHGWPGNPRDAIARGAAARVLIELGPAGLPAFDDLTACLRDPYVPPAAVGFAMDALAAIAPFAGARGRALAEDLVTNAPHAGSGLRREVLTSWKWLVSATEVDAAAAPLDALLDALGSPNPFAIVTACRSLAVRHAEFGDRARIVAALRELVTAPLEPHASQRWDLPVGTCALRLDRATVLWLRTHASLALCAFEPDDEHALLARSQQLFALDPEVRIAAARWLGRVRRPDAGRWLVDAARTAPPEVAVEALAAIVRTGPPLRHLGPDLLAIAKSATPEVADAAQLALRALAPDLDTVPAIRADLEIVGSGIPGGSAVRLAVERQRLEAWLDRDGGVHRRELQVDVRHIDAFHALAADRGGPACADVRWLPVRIVPDLWRPGHWERSLGDDLEGVVCAAPPGVLGPGRTRLEPLPWIVELVPTDRREGSFRRDDCRMLKSRAVGSEAIYVFRVDHAMEMAGLKHALFRRGGHLLQVVDGLVVWQRPVDANEAFDHPGGGFGLRPGAEDRRAALDALLDH